MRSKQSQTNIDLSDLVNYLQGRIKDNTGAGDGTPVNEYVYGDIHQFFAKLMALAGITPNGLPDNETNGYQLIDSLISLAGKNDFIYNISSVSGVLNIPLKLGILKSNEQIICKALVDKAAETSIKGTLDNTTKAVTFIGNFKANEYVRLINTPTVIILIRLVDLVNLDLAVSEFLYLKAATQAQENAGVLNTVATTPLTNALAFVERVNGPSSAASLAIAGVRNGLMSSAHATILENIGSSPIKNIGWISGIEIVGNPSGTPLARSGDITAASALSSGAGATRYLCTMANAMANVNYFVRMSPEDQLSNFNNGSTHAFLFKPISTMQFQIIVGENASTAQNIKLHLEVIQL